MDADAVVDWLLTEGLDIEELPALVESLASRMNEAGFGVTALWFSRLLSHPVIQATTTEWSAEKGAWVYTLPHGFARIPENLHSAPFELVGKDRRMWTARAADGPTPYNKVNSRFEAGSTHYFIYRTGPFDPTLEELSKLGALPPINVYSFTLAAEGDVDERKVRKVMHAVDAVVRTHVERYSGRSLLSAYLGRDAADRVFGGLIRRGEKTTIEAAIAFTDLRGFSTLSESMEAEDVLELLNDAFDAQVGAIQRNGGHVLKFMGDGMLAIWPEGECDAALAAALDMESSIAGVNERRTAEGKRSIDYGSGLHVGEVVYGNIGSVDRLDFTVIGRAVNRTARLESMCGRLGEKPLMTEAFASRVSAPVREIGVETAKGVGRIRVFGVER